MDILNHNQTAEMQSFISIVCVYGVPFGNQIVSKQAAESLLRQINEHPERAAIEHEGTLYTVKRAWLEGDETSGKLLAEYERQDKA